MDKMSAKENQNGKKERVIRGQPLNSVDEHFFSFFFVPVIDGALIAS